MAYEVVGYNPKTRNEGTYYENISEGRTFATRQEAEEYVRQAVGVKSSGGQLQPYEEKLVARLARRSGFSESGAQIRETDAPSQRTYTSSPLSASQEQDRREAQARQERRQAGISMEEERQLRELERAKSQGKISERSYQELASNIANKEELEKIAVANRQAREKAAAMRMDNASQPKDDLDRIRQEIERGAQQNAGQALKALPEEYRTPENVRRVGEYAQQVQEFESRSVGPAREALNRAEAMLGVDGSVSNGLRDRSEVSGSSNTATIDLGRGEVSPISEEKSKSEEFGRKASEAQFRSEFRSDSKLESAKEFSKGIFFGALERGYFIKEQPFNYAKAFVDSLINPIDSTKSLVEQAKLEPSRTIGGTFVDVAVSRGVAKAVEAQPFRIETVEVQTPQGSRRVTVIGGEVEGRSIILGGSVDGKPFVGRPSVLEPIAFADIQTPVPAPRTASATKALTDLLKTTPEDIRRVAAAQSIIRSERKNPGQRVEELVLNLEEPLRNPVESARIIDVARSQEGGVIFGSTLFQQLPEGFRRPTGDIDVIFPRRTEQELFIFTQDLATKLRKSGEDVRVSEKNPLIIERSSGSKLLEAKSGVNPTELSGPEVANAGGLGFDFPNLKQGQISNTVPFGEGRAIFAGEQLTRKGVASTFFRGFDERAPIEFQEGGIFPIGRRTKDLPDFVLQTRGLIAIDKASVNPFAQARALRAEIALNDFLGTFKPEQRLFIENKISESTGRPIEILQSIEPSPIRSPFARSPAELFGQSPFRASPFGDDFSPSPRMSPSPRILSPSSFGSPSSRSPSPSMRSPSAFSPSPSPRPSPILSPISPYEFASASPSFSPSRSPSPSPIFSPSPRFSPSVSPSPSPSPRSPFGISSPPVSVFDYYGEESPLARNKEAYDVYLRRGDKRGDKFVKIADDLPYNKALSYGARAADGNIENSFRIVRDGRTSEPDDFFGPDLSKFRFPKGNTKLPVGTFVEKNMFRLDTQDELDQISFFKKQKNDFLGGLF